MILFSRCRSAWPLAMNSLQTLKQSAILVIFTSGTRKASLLRLFSFIGFPAQRERRSYEPSPPCIKFCPIMWVSDEKEIYEIRTPSIYSLSRARMMLVSLMYVSPCLSHIAHSRFKSKFVLLVIFGGVANTAMMGELLRLCHVW